MNKNWKIEHRRTWYKITHYFELISLDEFYSLTDMSCWMLFPPSFYWTHTEEEIKQAEKEAIERIQKKIKEL